MLLSVEFCFIPLLLSVLTSRDNCKARHAKRRRLHSRRRRLHSRILLQSAPAVFIWHSPVKRRKQWTNIQMEKAMEAVKSGVGINRAAMECRVPCTILNDHISGHMEHGINSGPVTYLNKEEERELAVLLKKCASIGYGKTRKQVMAIVELAGLPPQYL